MMTCNTFSAISRRKSSSPAFARLSRRVRVSGGLSGRGKYLDRHIPDKEALIEGVVAWERERDRNKYHAEADWQFTTADARVALER